MYKYNLPIKLHILSKLEYKSDTTESATGMLRMVWFPFMDPDLKVFNRNSTAMTYDIQNFLWWYFKYPVLPYSRLSFCEMLIIVLIFRCLRMLESLTCFWSPRYSSPAVISTGYIFRFSSSWDCPEIHYIVFINLTIWVEILFHIVCVTLAFLNVFLFCEFEFVPIKVQHHRQQVLNYCLILLVCLVKLSSVKNLF